MRRCRHTGLSTRFRPYYECPLCLSEERTKWRRLLALLNPLCWFGSGAGQPVGPDGKVRPLHVREGGVGVLESAEKPRGLLDINSIADLTRHYQRHMVRPDYSCTILK